MGEVGGVDILGAGLTRKGSNVEVVPPNSVEVEVNNVTYSTVTL